MQIKIKWTTDVLNLPKPQVYLLKNESINRRLTSAEILNLIKSGEITDLDLIKWVKENWMGWCPQKNKNTLKANPLERKRENAGLKGAELYKYLDSIYGKVKNMNSDFDTNDTIKIGR